MNSNYSEKFKSFNAEIEMLGKEIPKNLPSRQNCEYLKEMLNRSENCPESIISHFKNLYAKCSFYNDLDKWSEKVSKCITGSDTEIHDIKVLNSTIPDSNLQFNSNNNNIESFYFFNDLEYSAIKLEYFNLLTFFIFAIFLSALLLFLSYYLAQQNPDSEKLSAYECGFEPYDDTRHSFEVKFCVIAILFVVFDIEIMFLIPWCKSIPELNLLGIWVLIDFLFELIVGFFFVWYSKTLEWKSKK